jgi:hypothetical protein
MVETNQQSPLARFPVSWNCGKLLAANSGKLQP